MVRQDFLNPPSGVKCSKKVEDLIWAKGIDCGRESGYGWTIIDASPDANEIKSMCQSATCRAMFTSMREISPTECVTSSGWYLNADLLNPILKGCETVPAPATGEPPYNGTATTTSAPTTATTPTSTAAGSPSVTVTPATAAPGLVTNAPAVTTVAPVADAGTQIVDSALSRGTIVAILSVTAVGLTSISSLAKFCYSRRQRKKAEANGTAYAKASTTRNKPTAQERDEGEEDDE